MNKSIMVLVLFILLSILLFGLNSKDPFDPLLNPMDYINEIIEDYKGFYK